MFLLNVLLIVIFNFEFFYLSSDQFIQQPLGFMCGAFSLPSLGAIGLAEKEILRFKFFMWPHKTAKSKSHVTPYVVSVAICHHPSNSGGIGLVEENIKFLIWHVTSYDHVIRVVRLHCELRPAMSASCKAWWPYVFWRKKYFVFCLSRDLMWPGGQRNTWLHGCIHLTISHQLPKFHGYRPYQRGYVTLLVCHVTTHHYAVRGSCGSIGRFLSP